MIVRLKIEAFPYQIGDALYVQRQDSLGYLVGESRVLVRKSDADIVQLTREEELLFRMVQNELRDGEMGYCLVCSSTHEDNEHDVDCPWAMARQTMEEKGLIT